MRLENENPQNGNPKIKSSPYFNINDPNLREPKRDCKSAPMFTQRDFAGELITNYQRMGDFVAKIMGCYCQTPAKNPGSGKGPAKREKCAYALGYPNFSPLPQFAAIPNPPPANHIQRQLVARANMARAHMARVNMARARARARANTAAPANMAPANLAPVNLAPANMAPANVAPANVAPPNALVFNEPPQNPGNYANVVPAMINRNAGSGDFNLMHSMERRNAGENSVAHEFGDEGAPDPDLMLGEDFMDQFIHADLFSEEFHL